MNLISSAVISILSFYLFVEPWCLFLQFRTVLCSWNVMAHSDARVEGNWRGNWRMEWVASTLHTTSEHVVSNITTADAHTSAASSRLNWRLCRFKWTRPFRRKKKSVFCACAVTFQLASTYLQESTATCQLDTWTVRNVCYVGLRFRTFYLWK